MTTDCECELAGYCNRHKVKKNVAWHRLCKSDPVYFRAWEAGTGPGQRTQLAELKLGPAYNHWMPLHYYAVKHWDDWNETAAKKWYRAWMSGLKQTGCGCAENWKTETAKYPPVFTSAEAFFQWTWLVHDAVSERLGKPRVSLAECYGIWMPV